jgi:hypothetical protein
MQARSHHGNPHHQKRPAEGRQIPQVAIRTLWQAALARSTATDVAVYDTLFVEVASRRRLPLVTFDAKIQGLSRCRKPPWRSCVEVRLAV